MRQQKRPEQSAPGLFHAGINALRVGATAGSANPAPRRSCSGRPARRGHDLFDRDAGGIGRFASSSKRPCAECRVLQRLAGRHAGDDLKSCPACSMLGLARLFRRRQFRCIDAKIGGDRESVSLGCTTVGDNALRGAGVPCIGRGPILRAVLSAPVSSPGRNVGISSSVPAESVSGLSRPFTSTIVQ